MKGPNYFTPDLNKFVVWRKTIIGF
jgi:hypothetical protein